jgi:arsenite methyltransferase
MEMQLDAVGYANAMSDLRGEGQVTLVDEAPAQSARSERVRDDTTTETVRQRYAELADTATEGNISCTPDEQPVFGASQYESEDLGSIPDGAALASLGCGNPTAVAALSQGEAVLDLGSGGGIDVILSARRVGPTGKAYGVDMTDEMLDLARRNAADAGIENVEFLKGHIEQVPLPDESVDVVISNCVINLSTDKAAVLSEMFRLLRHGGRVGVSDVVAEDRLSRRDREARGSYVGCIAGALSKAEYEQGLVEAGFVDASVEFTHEVADGMHGAIVRARKP